MKNATRVTVSTFGVLAGIAGIEHGIGELLQGNVAPNGLVIESWAGSELFRILAGEPAMTLIPNLLASGIRSVHRPASGRRWLWPATPGYHPLRCCDQN